MIGKGDRCDRGPRHMRHATGSKSTHLVRKDSMRRTTDSTARRTAFRDFHTSLKAQLGQS